jgi:trigger factor
MVAIQTLEYLLNNINVGGNVLMSAKWEKQEGNQGVLTIEVEAERVNGALDQAFQKVVKKVNVPGFRKGKVPRKIFEQKFGIESLYQDALDILLPEAYGQAIDETGIEPVDQPDVDIEQIEHGKNLLFTATVTVKPEVKLGEYKGLEVQEQNASVSDEDVEEEIKELQKKQADLAVKEDGEVENGDTVVIDFEGFVDGEAFEGGQAENYSLEIGSGSFIPGFEEQLVGTKAGEEKEVSVSFPEEYHSEDLAGKEALFKVKIHDIKTLELPELDDDFAKDVDEEVETLEALKTKVRERLEKERSEQADQQKREELINKATENTEVDVPEAMAKTELDRMVKEFEQRLQMQGMDLEMYYQFSGTSEESLKEQMQEDASKRVRTNLTLEAIVKAENIDVSEEDVDAEIGKMASMYNMEVEQLKQMLMLQGGPDAVKEDLKIRKAIDFLVENSKTVA